MKGKPGKTYCTGYGDESAMPIIDNEKCTKCGLCFKICPTETIIEKREGYAIDIDNNAGCIGCGQCMSVCADQAISVNGRRIQNSDVFKLPEKNTWANFDSLYGLLASRRSARHFKDQEIDEEVLHKIVDASALAPMGLPPWDIDITIINGKEKVQEFVNDSIKTFSSSLKMMRVITPLMKPFISKERYQMMKGFVIPITNTLVKDHLEGKDHLLYNAPAVMIFHAPAGMEADSIIACTYATIIAQSLGLGTCMIGTIAPYLQRDIKIKTKWEMPLDKTISMAMIIGYPKVKSCNGIRRTFNKVSVIK